MTATEESRARNRKSYAKHREARLAYARKYNKEHREERLAYARRHAEEIRAHDRKRYAENRDKRQAYDQKHYAEHRDKIQARNRKRIYQRKYGISADTYEDMYKSQGGCCLLCGKHHNVLCVDHCHTEGHVRGLLCRGCNSKLGYLEWLSHNPEWGLRAQEYLGSTGRVGTSGKEY